MRGFLMVFLGLGVVFGFGSGIASVRHRMHHGCHDWRDGRSADARGDWRGWREARDVQPEVKAAPQTVVQPQPTPAPLVFVIMPQGAAPAPQVVTVPVPASVVTPVPSGNVAPPANAP
ncbi:MAG: hypothetical protein AB1730_14800 [Myxococcota bacterium]|jgi:hypothetical protein